MDASAHDDSIVYTLLDVADESFARKSSSTPSTARPARTKGRRRTESPSVLEAIGFDGPSSVRDSGPGEPWTNRSTAIKPETKMPPRTDFAPPSLYVGPKILAMKPGKFDGTGSLDSFLAQFEVCARHNQWTATDKVDFLQCALEKAATQLLWDFGARTDVIYEQLVERLCQRYGTEGQAETFRAQLYYRRQRTDETLSDLLHDIRRLVVLASPVPANETTDIVAKDAFIEAMRDKELALKVREREPRTIDEAYRVALRLAPYHNATDADDRRRPQRVRGARGERNSWGNRGVGNDNSRDDCSGSWMIYAETRPERMDGPIPDKGMQ